MTKVEAITRVLEDHDGTASWTVIYDEIEKYYPTAKQSIEWSAGIRGVVYREIKNNKNFKQNSNGDIELIANGSSKLKPNKNPSITKDQAILKVLQDNGGIATREIIYNEIKNYYHESITPIEWLSLYNKMENNSNLRKIDEDAFAFFDYDENKLLLIPQDSITTKDIVSSIRIGQGEFRKKLITILRRCPITGIDDVRLLNASHIKPWTQSTNFERLDVNNGFLFSPTFDRLFDRGLISFTDNKELLISNSLSENSLIRLNLICNQVFPDLPISGREEYLAYHRKKIFLR